MRQPQEARDLALRLIQADPLNKNGYYLVGVADWGNAYQAIEKARQASGAPDRKGQLADAAARQTLRDQYLPVIEEGLRMTNRAVELDAGYDDAMAYTNLLLRLKAATADDPAEVAAWNSQADVWMVKAMAARRQQPSSAGRQDINAAPPPPPPPKDFGNQPASASPIPHGLPGPLAATGSFWQVVGDGTATARDLLGQLLGKGFRGKLVGTPEAAWVMAGPYSNEQALNRAKGELEAAGVHPLRVW
jgi:hypothetical protein